MRTSQVSSGVPRKQLACEPCSPGRGWDRLRWRRKRPPAPRLTGGWWRIVLGSGYRGTIEQLTPESRERVRSATDGWLQANAVGAVGAVETNVLYAVVRGAAP
jgi:hypothetical protein